MPNTDGWLSRERDIYRNLLRILAATDPTDPLGDVLSGLVELTEAERGYLELYQDASAGERRWTLHCKCSDSQAEEIRAVTSRGIVASAIGSGKTLHTPYAMLDERFASAESVQRQRLEAVLCVPLRGRRPGVLYLEGKRGKGPFDQARVTFVEQVAEFLGAAADRVTLTVRESGADPTLPFREKLRLDHIAGRSKALAYVFEQVALAAPLDVTVLLTGPSGTGKTQLARALHENSKRKSGPFVELNCAAIPEGLIESELFGTNPGAFPGARRAIGKVEAAEGGTLFLDEIAEIPYASQGKLLQLLQSKQYYALASPRVATANIRLICATNADLEQCIAERRFREDLYHRINVFTVRMPTLNERREDIPLLVDQLTARLADEHQLPRLPASPAFYAACEATDWTGHIRQLRHRLEGALIRACAEHAAQLEPRHFSDRPRDEKEGPSSFHEATRLFQRDLLRRELETTGWNVSEVARRLDLTRSHIYNLIKSFGLSRESAETR